MKKHLRLIYFLLLLGLNITALKAQTAFASEEELKKQAAKLFDEEAFEEAYPLYSQLTSIYPKDPNYNYRTGVCMLYAIDDKEQPISYLEFASKKTGVDKEVLFYLAKAYHLNYRFDDAIKSYLAYKNVASSSKAEKLQVDHQIEMCKSGKKLLHNLTDLVVIDKKEMSKADFFRAYDVSEIGGKLLVKPDDDQFKTALDKKKKETSIIYLATNNNQIYFSSYGVDPERGKDIFIIRKLPNGEWSPPQTLGYPINTEYDEDFPFLHPNGKVLYFCSKGHNSMGGYDIFKSILNQETDTWNKPVNMDFPINTPDDDILYVTNVDEKEAYFSSARSSTTGKTAVYHIKSDRKSIDKAIIKGDLVKNREGQSMDIKITVKDMKDNAILGIYNSKNDGSYHITLPNGGKFLYTVETKDFTTQSEVIELPVQNSFSPLKQEISYELNTDKLLINNLFSQTNTDDDTGYLAVLSLIKEKSKLEVNINDVVDTPPSSENVDSSTPVNNTDASASSIPKKNTSLNNDDIIKIAYDDSKEADIEAKEAREQADIALSLANQKNELAQSKTDEAKKLMADAAAITDNTQKQVAISQAKALTKEAEVLNEATVVAFNLVKKLEKSAAAKQQESDLSQKYAKDLETAVKAKNSSDALIKLEDQKQKLETLSQEKTSVDDIFSSLKIDSDNKERELNKAVQASTDIKQEMTDNITLMGNVQLDADKAKNDQLKQGLIDQIADIKQENIDKQKELEQNELKIARLQKEFNGIKNETELVTTVISRSKTETNETAAASIEKIDKNKLEEQVNSLKTETPTDTPVAVIDTPTEDKPTTPAAPKVDTEAFVKLNEKYTADLNAAEKMENVKDKEEIKADVLKTWSEAINTEVAKQKQDFATTTDPETKIMLAKNITDAEQLSKEKKTQADESLAKVETIKQQEAILAANATPNNTVTDSVPKPAETTVKTTNSNITAGKPIAIDTVALTQLNEKHTDNLATAEKIVDVVERESAKAEVLKKWSEEIDVEVTKQKQDFVTATDPETKTLLANRISESQKLSEEKQMQANASLAKVEVFKQENTVAVVPAATNSDTLNKNNIVKNDDVVQNNGLVAEGQFLYTAPSAAQQAQKATVLNKEADDLTNRSKELKTQAKDLATVEEQTKAYAQAEELNKQAENKIIEAAEIIATANKTEYTAHQSRLEDLAQAAANTSADDLTTAEMLKDEAKLYFEKAQSLRSQVTNADSYYSKETVLDEAYTNEMFALEKQKKANDIYKKYNNNFVALKPKGTGTPTSTVVVAGNQTKGANEPNPNVTSSNPKNTGTPVNAVVANKTSPINNSDPRLPKANDTLMLYSDPPLIRDSTTDNIPKPVVVSRIPEIIGDAIDAKPITSSDISKSNAVVYEQAPNANRIGYLKAPISLTSNEKYESRGKPVYSATKPIPVNEKLPEGLIFKVQIGAFRNAIPQNLFKGITPITGETTPQGFIRYTAGIFVKFPTADNVKKEIRSLGYKDAFVVAFLNGKRIPINEALIMAGIDPSTVPQSSISPVSGIATPVATSTVNTTTNTTTQPANADAAPAEKISAVNGLFYTVQIGVYSQPVAASKLFNVKPLYSETTAAGMVRYTTGIYNSEPRAVEAKNSIVNVGIKDAFVIAYYFGKRVSLPEAALVANQDAGAFAAVPNTNVLPTFNNVTPKSITAPRANNVAPTTNNQPVTTINNQPTVTTEQPKNINETGTVNNTLKTEVAKNNLMPIDSGVVFKVQIGAFKDEVPIDIANKFLQIANKGIKNYKDENGLTIYTVGTYSGYDDADKIKSEIVASGITDAFIVAYSDGKKITVEEAKQLINK